MPRWEGDRRAAVLAAAARLFSGHGYESTTLAMVAETAGVSRSTVFRLFADKEQLWAEGQAGVNSALVAALRRTAAVDPPVARLQAALAVVLAAVSGHDRQALRWWIPATGRRSGVTRGWDRTFAAPLSVELVDEIAGLGADRTSATLIGHLLLRALLTAPVSPTTPFSPEVHSAAIADLLQTGQRLLEPRATEPNLPRSAGAISSG